MVQPLRLPPLLPVLLLAPTLLFLVPAVSIDCCSPFPFFFFFVLVVLVPNTHELGPRLETVKIVRDVLLSDHAESVK